MEEGWGGTRNDAGWEEESKEREGAKGWSEDAMM